MTDIHCHIIPGVDDGVRDLDEALALIRMEVSGGTSTFVATPHVIEKTDYGRLDKLAEGAAKLREAVSEAGLQAKIVQGAEVYPSSKMLEALDEGLPVTVGGLGRHMLIDLPMTSLPQDFEALLYGVQVRGVTPIVAHPERCRDFQERPEFVRTLREKGVLFQVNAGSLKGRYGSKAQEVAERILKSRWAHFVASDAHRPSRSPSLEGARARLTELVGREYAEYLTSAAPESMANGADLPPMPAAPPPEKGFLARLLHRS